MPNEIPRFYHEEYYKPNESHEHKNVSDTCTYVFMCYLINRFSTSMGLSRKGLIPKSTSCY